MLESNLDHFKASKTLSSKLKKSFLYRAQAVFFGRLAINSLYGLLWIIALADNSIKFERSFLTLLTILFSFSCAYLCYRLKSHKNLGKWAHFVTLIIDLFILIYFTQSSGYLLSPLMAIHPFITAMFLLLFHNPAIIAAPLLTIPLSTVLSLWGSHDPSFLSVICSLMLACFLDALAIFFIYLVQSQEQRLLQSLISMKEKLKTLAIERERQRMAREFHDGLGAQLTSIVMQCDYVKRYLQQSELKNDINEIQNCAIESIDDMRRSIAFLNKDFDIAEQIIILCQNMSHRHKVPIKTLSIELMRKLSLEQQLAACRIVQEGLSNALKHAQAQEICVSVRMNPEIIIAIKDNGNGFDTSLEHHHHYGLVNMKARAQLIGGQLTLTSKKNAGTTIELAIH